MSAYIHHRAHILIQWFKTRISTSSTSAPNQFPPLKLLVQACGASCCARRLSRIYLFYSHTTLLEQPNWLAHRGLDMQRLDVLPVFLEQRNEEVDACAYPGLATESSTICRDSLSMTFANTWSSVMSTWPTATPRHRTFFSWNLIVEQTSVILLLRSSA